ncbi:secretion protein HlyD [Coraliomargarita sinensis]|uniref:Secretion protein HlyD n=1 Tax=Coraliomargarita sinensis TaxID=2174842 RepID=A0A317ZG81_9BACT|nr:PQQ-dependent sugar dehydrogenase [Coraliomargarita sinensis]PXA03223.1 secretion protein HlyD [Coraliomargarita sinensis]
MLKFILISSSLLGLAVSCFGQLRIGTGKVESLYTQHCQVCHGENLDGGLGGSLIDRKSWKIVGKDQTFLEYVLAGNAATGMPAFKDKLTRPQIRALEIYIDEQRQIAQADPPEADTKGVYSSGGYDFKLETVVEGLDIPWSMAFLPNGDYLIAERPGPVRLFEDGELLPPVEDTPDVWAKGQGGMMEVALHPDFRKNGWVYLAYSAAGEENDSVGMTKIVRGRIIDNMWLDEELIFEAPEETYISTSRHFGTRLVFKDGYLYFAIGDRGRKENAQDLSLPNGKIHRVHDDGRVPEDNPFADKAGAFPTIWTYGNRNPQGLDMHPTTGAIWESEHGPRGGDEINRIERGINYGWPVITYGMNYSGTPITEKTEMEGMEQPKLYWTPSIAVCGIDFYEGNVFPEWKHDLFAGGLASKELHRLEIESGEVANSSIVMKGAGRVRDVASGPDGYLYLVLNGPDRIVRLVPVK